MPRKEINTFSISFLDLIAGALGAVLILFIIVPKLTSEQQATLDKLEQFEQTQRELKEAQREIEKLRAQNKETVEGKIFGVDAQLAVVCMWPENIDVDLYIKNLQTQEVCFYGKKRTPFGSLFEDIVSRESADDNRYELFYQQRIVPGRYLLYVNIFTGADLSRANRATVDGYVVLFPGKKNEIKINYRQIRLTRPGVDVKIGTLTVTNNNITLEQ